MSNQVNDENVGLLRQLVTTVQKKNDKEKVDNSIKMKPAKVIGVDEDTYKVFVYFIDDTEQNAYTFYNKSGEVLTEGDNVRVYYTTNSAKGWIGAKCGEPSIKESTVYGGEGVGRPSPWDKTSEYFNYYDEKNHNIAGDSTLTESLYATARGYYTQATGYYSSAEGSYTKATYSCTHAEGNNTEASGFCSHAEGLDTKASGQRSHAEGNNTTASGSNSHAEGERTSATGESSHADGYGTQATGYASYASGQYTQATNSFAHAEGNGSVASGQTSHAEGQYTTASGSMSHSEGSNCVASGIYSHAEGFYSQTGMNAYAAHTEGNNTTASGSYSHSEGNFSSASGDGSHAEGNSTSASGQNSHAEGSNCVSTGEASHTGGESCTASLPQSFAHGYGLKMPEDGKSGTAVLGQYNDYSDKNIIFSIGNGSSDSNRSNAFSVDNNGNIYCNSIIQTGTTTAADWSDDNSDGLTYTAVSENVIKYGEVTYTFTTTDTGEYTGVTTSTGKSMTANIPAGLGNIQTHNAAFIALAMMSLK